MNTTKDKSVFIGHMFSNQPLLISVCVGEKIRIN